MGKIKKNRENKLKFAVYKNKDLIIERLKEEWKEAEEILARQKRKEQLIELAKSAGVAAGKGLLTLLLVGGVMTVAAIAPNIFSAIGRSIKSRRCFDKKQFNKEKRYFKRHGLIEIKKIDNNTFEIYLTEKGERLAMEDAFKNFKIQKPQRDGYWRMVMFDIPDKHKWTRDIFRQKLRIMGFYQLQESVFILPYPCEKEVSLLVEILNIVDFIYLIKTKDFSDNKELKEMFD
ncbi:MAG: hypothetical protein AAB464_00680 [Patescibacteria group bacterium]